MKRTAVFFPCGTRSSRRRNEATGWLLGIPTGTDIKPHLERFSPSERWNSAQMPHPGRRGSGSFQKNAPSRSAIQAASSKPCTGAFLHVRCRACNRTC